VTPQNSAYTEAYLRPGVKFLVDTDFYSKIKKFPFHGHHTGEGLWYVSVGVPVLDSEGYKRHRFIHLARLVVGLEEGNPLVADHINGNPLDNRRINLRVCPHAKNMLNRRMHKNNTSGFKGVTQVGPNRWAANIALEGHFYYLGVFDSPEKAHQAYCEAAAWLHGEFANFGEDRSGGFSLAVRPAMIPLALATTARKRRTQRARGGVQVWGLSKGPRPDGCKPKDFDVLFFLS
jgi:HNH endonuclease